MRLRTMGAGVALAALAIACGASEADDGQGSDEALGAKNLGRQDFGLQDGELILTLDDGPGPRTKEVVDFLVKEQIPAVFFMVGNNARSNTDAMNYVAANSSKVPGGLIIGNHSLTHTTPLPKQGVDGTVNEIMTTDGIIGDAIKKAQTQFPTQIPFFRPPYGAFTSLGQAKIDQVNDKGGEKYVGPIFWEIGGELAGKYSADWACWGKKISIADCRQGYINETLDRKKGLILVHDVHSKTVDMLTGKGDGISLIKELRDKHHFKFVGLRAHDKSISNFADAQRPVVVGDIRATAERHDDGNVEVVVDIAPTGGKKGVVIFDGDEGQSKSFEGSATITRKLNPGQHRITIVALSDKGEVLRRKDVGIVVPMDAPEPEASSDHAPCVNFQKLTPGRPFKLFIKKADCSAAGANEAVGGECYKYNGTLHVAKTADGKAAVRMLGGSEWSVEYDLTFPSDPNDKSKISLILEAGSGNIITGKRHAFTNARGAAVNRPDVPLDETAIDCNEGIWRGAFTYANGTKEEFLFRKPVQGEPEYNDR